MDTGAIVNLTPHVVTIVDGDSVLEFPPAPVPARCQRSEQVERELVLGPISVPLRQVQFGAVTGLPMQRPGVFLVVSRLVAEAMPHRCDLVVPDGTIRDERGQVTGCTGLATLATRHLDAAHQMGQPDSPARASRSKETTPLTSPTVRREPAD